MTDKELLEEAKEWRNDLLLTLVTTDLSDDLKKYTRKYKEILNGLIEQAERAQELESNSYNAHLERLLDRREQQIKRYREALEEIAQKRITYADMAEVLMIAHKTLEGEEIE